MRTYVVSTKVASTTMMRNSTAMADMQPFVIVLSIEQWDCVVIVRARLGALTFLTIPPMCGICVRERPP
jgi:hypothetical protein